MGIRILNFYRDYSFVVPTSFSRDYEFIVPVIPGIITLRPFRFLFRDYDSIVPVIPGIIIPWSPPN